MITSAYEELGGAAAEVTLQSRPRAHQWKLIAQERAVSKHRCGRCGSTRTRINQGDRFPSTRYLTRNGQHSDKAPPCQPDP